MIYDKNKFEGYKKLRDKAENAPTDEQKANVILKKISENKRRRNERDEKSL